MNEQFDKNATLEQLTKMVFYNGEEKGLIVKDPLINWHIIKTYDIIWLLLDEDDKTPDF